MTALRRLITMVVAYPLLSGFVLLREQEVVLPATTASPEIQFVWDGKAPPIQQKDKYGDGTHGGLDDVAMMALVLQDAMSLWNDVPGSFVRLKAVSSSPGEPAVDDPLDNVNSILVVKDSNISSAALAAPQINSANPGVIGDCDIHVNTTPVPATELGFILTHELGHCLGLGHSHDNYGAIMGYSRANRSMTLGTDDRTGVIYLYPDPQVFDGKMRELAACGTVAAADGDKAMPWSAAVTLLLPLAGLGATCGARRRRARLSCDVSHAS